MGVRGTSGAPCQRAHCMYAASAACSRARIWGSGWARCGRTAWLSPASSCVCPSRWHSPCVMITCSVSVASHTCVQRRGYRHARGQGQPVDAGGAADVLHVDQNVSEVAGIERRCSAQLHRHHCNVFYVCYAWSATSLAVNVWNIKMVGLCCECERWRERAATERGKKEGLQEGS
jgi:hypothetical protein